jgi:glycosyltransferase Alg8
VIDGDTVLGEGVVRKTVPWFQLFGNVGGLTTNEFCEVRGGYIMSEWHKLRFAQRHINMCSMALSKRVLTMTGRMSVFRASVVTDPDFIADVESDSLQHWRLGRFKFLTGDDKVELVQPDAPGLRHLYVPDAAINTVEHPPEKSFIKASRKLMFRWYGNNLRRTPAPWAWVQAPRGCSPAWCCSTSACRCGPLLGLTVADRQLQVRLRSSSCTCCGSASPA